MTLDKLERNQFYDSIINAELEPAEFNLKDTGNKVTITHSSGSTFKFSRRLVKKVYGAALYEYDLTASVAEGRTLIDTVSDIHTVLNIYYSTWLDEIRLTIGVPDYWEDMKRRRHLLAEIKQESMNAPFTSDEQEQIAAQLQEVTRKLEKQFELTTEQVERIEEWRNEVVDASTRMGRKDWIIYLLGTITALTIAATVPAGIGEHIFAMVIQGLGHLFTGGSEPPQIVT